MIFFSKLTLDLYFIQLESIYEIKSLKKIPSYRVLGKKGPNAQKACIAYIAAMQWSIKNGNLGKNFIRILNEKLLYGLVGHI